MRELRRDKRRTSRKEEEQNYNLGEEDETNQKHDA